jgi:esterase
MQTLFYREINADKLPCPTVILLHGLFGMSDNLLGLAKALLADFHIVLPDLINHGKSVHRSTMTYRDMAEDVIGLLNASGIKKASFVGHSMGGKVAMQIASTYPETVNHLIVADIAPVLYPERHNEIIQAMRQVQESAITQRKQAEHILLQFIPDKALIAFFLKNMRRDDNGLWQWCFGLNEISHSYSDICAAPGFEQAFMGKVLFIKGELSDYITVEHADIIRKWFPAVQYKMIQGAGHWLHAEKPEAFNRLVRGFLQA